MIWTGLAREARMVGESVARKIQSLTLQDEARHLLAKGIVFWFSRRSNPPLRGHGVFSLSSCSSYMASFTIPLLSLTRFQVTSSPPSVTGGDSARLAVPRLPRDPEKLASAVISGRTSPWVSQCCEIDGEGQRQASLKRCEPRAISQTPRRSSRISGHQPTNSLGISNILHII
jgi:hypothetical protein